MNRRPQVDQATAAVAAVAYIAGEYGAGRDAETEVLSALLDDTVPKAIAFLAGVIVARVSGARDELERIGRDLACREAEAP
jgi:hypothetical protein